MCLDDETFDASQMQEKSDPLLDAMQIVRAEVQRANKLFPDDETEAICELLRRSHQLPDVKRAMLVICAAKLIEAERHQE